MLTGQYVSSLVLVSVLVAVLASFTALSLASRVSGATGRARWLWIGGGAISMGTGIWAMHFVGMLAFRLPITLGYDLYITVLSWLIPVMASALALWQISRAQPSLLQLSFSALLIGIGINAMHYVGMSALRIAPGIVYDMPTVAASLAIAIVAAAAALWMAFIGGRAQSGAPARRAAASILLGLGIVGMHYTGMASAQFPMDSICLAANSGVSLDNIALAVIIATLGLLGVTLLTSGYDARLGARNEVVRITAEISQERLRLLECERTARAVAENARETAEKTSLEKDEFLATLSHELRTPLNAILGWAQLLQGRAELEAGIRSGLQVIERNARSQGRLIDDLLDLSGIARGKVRLELALADVASILNAAVLAAAPSAERKAIKISRDIDMSVGRVFADRTRLEQVFGNLLVNAVKFTPESGRIAVSSHKVGNDLAISFTDTGLGIQSDFLPHVFDLFRQADGSTTRRHGGLGIGLSIVRQLVELHGGSISAESAGLGHGATFTVRLPIAGEHTNAGDLPADGALDASAHAAVDLDGLNILVVDDDADSRQLITTILSRSNARVRHAASANDALAMLFDAAPDVLISDIGMPDIDGITLIKRVRGSNSPCARVPAIAVSAYTRNQDRELALDAGFSFYLEKPLDGAQLLDVLVALSPAAAFPG